MTTDKSAAGVESESLRGAHRSRRLRSGILSAILSRGLAAIAPLLLVPITFRYLGTELYGLWAAILSMTSMAAWADLGLGNGLMTRLTPVIARGDTATGRRLVASTYLMLTLLALVAVTALLLLVHVLPWGSLLNVGSDIARDAAPTIASITIGAFLLNIPLSLIHRVQFAYQEITQSNAWLAAGSLASVGLAWLAVLSDLGVGIVVLTVAVGPLLANALNTVWFFARHPALVPTRRDIGGKSAKAMLGLGGQFFLVSVLSATALNVDTLIITHSRGLGDAAVFSVAYRLMSALGLLVTLINMPLWPANAEAIANGDVSWVLKTTRRMSLLSATAVLGPGVVLVVFQPAVFGLWLGPSAELPGRLLLLVLTLWWTVLAAVSPLFMVQNAVGEMRPQLVGWAAFLVLSLILKVSTGSLIGTSGVVMAGIASYLITLVPAAVWGYLRSVRRAIPEGANCS